MYVSGVNVALNGTASQSSDYGVDYNASNAIDGNATSYSFTVDAQPYWELDLAQAYSIDSIEIVNDYTNPFSRKLVDSSYSGLDSIDMEDNSCRLSNSSISLVDADGFVIISRSAGDTCSHSTISLSFNTSSSFSRVSDGDGWCLDSHGYYYPYVRQDASSNLTATECGAWCTQHPSSLIGFDYYKDPSGEVNKCYCLFSNDVPDTIGAYIPQYNKLSLGEMGVGPITSVSGDADYFCYRNEVSCSRKSDCWH